MKKVISIVALLIIVILLLTGCSSTDITIEYGIKGDYGENVEGGDNTIYNIPAGTYKVSLSAESTANVGFLTIRDSNTKDYNIIDEYKFDFENNNKHTITIKEGQYVHITAGTVFHIYE